MRRSKKPIRIASRRSPLARIQAERVGSALARLHPRIAIEYLWIQSEGDQTQGALAAHGGKGLFTRAVDQAVLAGDADLAVHSLKDVPADGTALLALAAVPKRVDPRDCLIAAENIQSLDDLPMGALIGTSSPRRAAQLLRVRPDLRLTTLRGNVQTRIDRVLNPTSSEHAPLTATLLASAGLHRLGLQAYRRCPLSVEQMLPAACQGALGLMCRPDDHVTLTRCLPLNDPAASTACHAERQLVAALKADCHSPIAVHAVPVDPKLTQATRNADSHWFDLSVRVLSVDGRRCLSRQERVKTKELRHLVKRFADELIQEGADRILDDARHHAHLPRQPLSEAIGHPDTPAHSV